jgi:hypothetical protein
MRDHFNQNGVPGAAGAHLHLSEAAVAETPRTSTARKVLALVFAVAYLIAAPLVWAQSAEAKHRHGDDGSGVTQGSSGPGGGGHHDDDDDEAGAGGDDDGDDNQAGTAGTSARGHETQGTSAAGDSTNGTNGTSAKGDESQGTSAAGDSTNGTNGTSAPGDESQGTSAAGDSTHA